MAKTTLILGNICAFVFEKNSRLLNKTDQFPLKKFNFSMAVFQTSMKMLKKAQKVKAARIKIKSKQLLNSLLGFET